jgi:phosphoserine phosphatase
MRFVITLITAGRDSGLPRHAANVADALAIRAEPVWLAAEEACDLFVDASEPEAIGGALRAVIAEAAVDTLIQPIASRRKRLLVADLESTIIENEMLDELGRILGIGRHIAEITRQAMNGEIDFARALAARVALLAGIETGALAEAATRITLMAGAQSLVATMRRDGAMTALVSGGFTVFADRVGAALGFDRVVANRLEIAEDRLTGRVLPPIVTGETKRQTLLALAAEFGIAAAETIAVGDGANDLPMLGAAGFGVAFRAKPVVAVAARGRLDHADLTGLLYAQGYLKADFADLAAAPQP